MPPRTKQAIRYGGGGGGRARVRIKRECDAAVPRNKCHEPNTQSTINLQWCQKGRQEKEDRLTLSLSPRLLRKFHPIQLGFGGERGRGRERGRNFSNGKRPLQHLSLSPGYSIYRWREREGGQEIELVVAVAIPPPHAADRKAIC